MIFSSPFVSIEDARALDANARLIGACFMSSIALSQSVCDLALVSAEDALASLGISEFFGAPFNVPT